MEVHIHRIHLARDIRHSYECQFALDHIRSPGEPVALLDVPALLERHPEDEGRVRLFSHVEGEVGSIDVFVGVNAYSVMVSAVPKQVEVAAAVIRVFLQPG